MKTLLAAALLGASLVASSARADIEVSALGGYSLEGQRVTTTGDTAYGVGFGARVGVRTDRAPLYLGIAFTHWLGTNRSATGANSQYEARYDTTLFGIEAGYEAELSKWLVLRPYLGAGLQYAHARTIVNGVEANDDAWRPYLAPGVLAKIPIGSFYVGLDVRGVLAPLNRPKSWAPGVFFAIGYRF